jgi:hypothetical protein
VLLLLLPRRRPRARATQVTHHQLEQMRADEAAQRSAELRERDMVARREVSADAYAQLVDAENANRQEDTGVWGSVAGT